MKNKKNRSQRSFSNTTWPSSYGARYLIRGKSNKSHYSNLLVKHDHTVLVVIAFVLILGFIGVFSSREHQVSAGTTEIKAGNANNCLNFSGGTAGGTDADIKECDGSVGENWIVSSANIKHDDNSCLSVKDNSISSGSLVVLASCDNSAGQVWLTDNGGLYNPNSGLCLSTPGNKLGRPLDIESCRGLSQPSESWSAETVESNGKSVGYTSNCNSGSEGDRVACYAEQQWAIWQSGSPNHATLLNNYSGGNGYEEWCADFVSYVYREAGFSFSQGERNGWDEYLATNIQNMGFTIHQADGYIPQTGDVAFFDYGAGHVEIVINGGLTPTFIYGDSGTIDPSTGNGDMAANTITSDGSNGQVIYYLSPN